MAKLLANSALRNLLRAQRRLLAANRQARVARALARCLRKLPAWRAARRIGLYSANDGEADPAEIIRLAWQQGKRCYLPRINANGTLQFYLYQPGSKLVKNRYGISEPARALTARPLARLDLLLVPLVAFDAAGNRLGMGSGYYDRLLAHRPYSRRAAPLLLGLAHGFQQVRHLHPEPWDIPLDGVVTEAGLCLSQGYSRKRR